MFFADNTLYFWKYPEDEEKQAPIEHESISLHNCTTEIVGPTPREVCSRQNTYMLKCRRSYKSGDVEGLNTRVVSDSIYFTYTYIHTFSEVIAAEVNELFYPFLNYRIVKME